MKTASKKISSAAKFIDFFVHDMLDYTVLTKKAQNFAKQIGVFDAKEAIEELATIMEDKVLLKNIDLATEFQGFDANQPLVKSDRKRFQQVLLNLVSNAVKFTENGTIRIVVERLENFVRASVVDSGIGIKPEDQPKLFKMFGSIKDTAKKINTSGIGLGLVISKLIVEHFGGTIGFESEYQRGTTFYFTFEAAEIDAEADQLPRRMSSAFPQIETVVKQIQGGNPTNSSLRQLLQHCKNRILIVDDEEFCLTSMREMFKMAGVDVDNTCDFFYNSQHALEFIKTSYEHGFMYKFIFTDFSMPLLDGIQLTRKVRKFLTFKMQLPQEQQPIIIGVTGHVDDHFKEEGKRAGMNDVHSKPFYFAAIKDVLSEFCYQ